MQEQPPGVIYEKGFDRCFAKFLGKHLCQSFFFSKVAGLLGTLFLQNTSGRLLLIAQELKAWLRKSFWGNCRKYGKWSLCEKHLFKRLFKMRCSVELRTLKIPYKNVKKVVRNTCNKCSGGSPASNIFSLVVLFLWIFSIEIINLRNNNYRLFSLTAMCRTRIYLFCFFVSIQKVRFPIS